MKKITYKSISSALTNKQLKNILGGSGSGGSGVNTGCNGRRAGDSCTGASTGRRGTCERRNVPHFGYILVCVTS